MFGRFGGGAANPARVAGIPFKTSLRVSIGRFHLKFGRPCGLPRVRAPRAMLQQFVNLFTFGSWRDESPKLLPVRNPLQVTQTPARGQIGFSINGRQVIEKQSTLEIVGVDTG